MIRIPVEKEMLSRDICSNCRKEQRRRKYSLIETDNLSWRCPGKIFGHDYVGLYDRVNSKCPKMFEQLVWLSVNIDKTQDGGGEDNAK